MEGSAESVHVSRRGDTATLTLRGTVGVAAAETLLEAAREASASRAVEVRLDDAEHLDASALQILLALREKVERAGHPFRVTGAGEGVRTYARLAGLDTLVATTAAPARNRKRR